MSKGLTNTQKEGKKEKIIDPPGKKITQATNEGSIHIANMLSLSTWITVPTTRNK